MEQLINTIIFTGAAICIIELYKFHRKNKISKRAWLFAISAILLIPFGLAWGVTSFYEHEPQAAWVGIVVFSGTGLVFGILSYQNIFPKPKQVSSFQSIYFQKLGFRITTIVLMIIGTILLPLTFVSHKIGSTFSNEQRVLELLSDNMLSDKVLPSFIKKTLAYETLYGEYPDKLEERMMQSLISGVKEDEMIYLLNFVLPEKERIALLTNGSHAVKNWINSTDAYPKMEIEPKQFIIDLDNNAREIAKWFYKNFELPPMSEATVLKFENGEFSNTIEDYMGTPPDHIKDKLIEPFANIIRTQLASISVPEKISLAEEISNQIPEAEMIKNKSKLKNLPLFLKYIWLIPKLLLIAGFILLFIARFNFLKWTAWFVFAFAIRLISCYSIFSNAQTFIDGIIPDLAENVPLPALALLHKLIPELLSPLGQNFGVALWILLAIGVTMLLIVYWETIKKYFYQINI